MRRTRRTRSAAPRTAPVKLSDGRHAGTRSTQRMIDHDCVNDGPNCEPVRAPADVARVTCGRCVQKMVGGAVLPPPPLTQEERLAKLVESRKAKQQQESAA